MPRAEQSELEHERGCPCSCCERLLLDFKLFAAVTLRIGLRLQAGDVDGATKLAHELDGRIDPRLISIVKEAGGWL